MGCGGWSFHFILGSLTWMPCGHFTFNCSEIGIFLSDLASPIDDVSVPHNALSIHHPQNLRPVVRKLPVKGKTVHIFSFECHAASVTSTQFCCWITKTDRMWTNECDCGVPIKLYVWTLKFEFRVVTKYFFPQLFKNIWFVALLGCTIQLAGQVWHLAKACSLVP